MCDIWHEIVSQVTKKNGHELVLTGPEISNKIQESGLDLSIFTLEGVNYLNINHTCLEKVPAEIERLKNLTNLVLHSNAINTLPTTLGNLSKLKVLDCSRNKLEEVPSELGNLPLLMTLNLGSNLLNFVPSQINNTKICVIDLSHNKFEVFPDVCYPELVHLAELRINDNQIKELPPNICVLSSLKLLDLGNNQISVIPGEVADCMKLKDLNLKGNKLSDKRLLKLVDQCRTKQVIDYARQHCPKTGSASGNGNRKTKKNRKDSRNSESEQVNAELEQAGHKLQILRVSETVPVIKITDSVKKVRPYILACIVRNLNFTEDSFKKFIQLQTRFHEKICQKRNAATIATHDFNLLTAGDLTYTAMLPQELEIKPLMRTQMYTGAQLFHQLQKEAEQLRKERKSNVYSGIHKYLYLLEGKPLYPCLMDSKEQIISFPPITNSDLTKMCQDTKTMFLEVTSALNQQICKKVLDEFLKELLIQGLGCAKKNDGSNYNEIIVEQVKVVDLEGNLKSVYPSRTDAQYEDKSIIVERQ